MSADILMFLGALHAKVAVFTAAVLGMVYATRRISSQNRYLVMRMALGIVAVVPLLMLVLPRVSFPLGWWQHHLAGSAATIPPINASDGAWAATTGSPISMVALVLAGYLSISALLLLRTAAGILRTRADIKRYRQIDQPAVMSLLDQVRRQLGMKDTVGLVVDSSGVGPYVWGIRKQLIAVPRGFLAAMPEIQRTVLTHELIHVIRRDTTTCLTSRLLCCLYWINPAIWLLHARLQLEMERSCDDRAVCAGINAADYADHLLQAIRQFDLTHRPISAVAMARAS